MFPHTSGCALRVLCCLDIIYHTAERSFPIYICRVKEAFLPSPHHAVFNTETFIVDSAVAFNYMESHGDILIKSCQADIHIK